MSNEDWANNKWNSNRYWLMTIRFFSREERKEAKKRRIRGKKRELQCNRIKKTNFNCSGHFESITKSNFSKRKCNAMQCHSFVPFIHSVILSFSFSFSNTIDGCFSNQMTKICFPFWSLHCNTVDSNKMNERNEDENQMKQE